MSLLTKSKTRPRVSADVFFCAPLAFFAGDIFSTSVGYGKEGYVSERDPGASGKARMTSAYAIGFDSIEFTSIRRFTMPLSSLIGKS